MLLAQTLSKALVGLLQTSGFQFFAVTFDLNPNWRVLLFAAAVTLVTTLLFGLAPAVLATRPSNGALLRGDDPHVDACTARAPPHGAASWLPRSRLRSCSS